MKSNFTLKDCFFVIVKVANNVDPDISVYSDYGTGFDLRSEFSLPHGSVSVDKSYSFCSSYELICVYSY